VQIPQCISFVPVFLSTPFVPVLSTCVVRGECADIVLQRACLELMMILDDEEVSSCLVASNFPGISHILYEALLSCRT